MDHLEFGVGRGWIRTETDTFPFNNVLEPGLGLGSGLERCATPSDSAVLVLLLGVLGIPCWKIVSRFKDNHVY